jgi:hypothetical protein
VRILKVLLGLSLGLVLAEAVFWFRDDGAFPHLNIYLPHPHRGVSLQPYAEQKLRVATDNPVTTVRVNSDGFRAPNWPEATEGEVLVVGDSQVFGLGVEENETFSAKLSELLKRPVLNGGVPTYGPREYTDVVEATLRRRNGSVKTVVYVLNLSNDLFEVDRPNTQRHAVWDGWAVRAETAPTEVTSFPFRQWFMSRSHLVFALRQVLHASGPVATEGFAATEGTWKDVVQASSGVKPLPPEDDEARALLQRRGDVAKQLEAVASELQNHIEEKISSDDRFAEALRPLVRGGDPRDILYSSNAESARRVDLTAYHLLMASLGTERNEGFLATLATQRKDPELFKLLETRKTLRGTLDALRPSDEPAHVLPIEAVLAKTKKLCDQHHAKLLVVALPLDVMVSDKEWEKYGVPALDMTPTRALVEDVVARSERLGAEALDPTEALQKAEPGAFLNGDLHLTPKGHAALAAALHQKLELDLHPTLPPKDVLVLPPGRSWPPTEDEWRRAPECVVKGSTAAGCETKLIREWLRVLCRDTNEDDTPYNAVVLEGGHGDARVYRHDGLGLLIPLVEGDVARVRFEWDTKQRELRLDWPRGGERVMAFAAEERRRGPITDTAKWVQDPAIDPLAPVTCPRGQAPFGALRRCAEPCEADGGCQTGHCESWPTVAFCAEP